MLTFFRQIRRFLIESGSTKRYIGYAFGEIVLVVLGILIALQINNWNEDRKDRIEEHNILVGLQKEFEMNDEQLTFVTSIHRRSYRAVLKLIEMADGHREIPANEEMDTLWILSQESWTFDPTRGLSNSLINSGKIDLIRSDSLKLLLVSWNDFVNDYKEDELELRKFGTEIQAPFLLDKVVDLGFTAAHLDRYEGPSANDYHSVISMLEYRNMLMYRKSWHDEIRREGDALNTTLKEIIELLAQEIVN